MNDIRVKLDNPVWHALRTTLYHRLAGHFDVVNGANHKVQFVVSQQGPIVDIGGLHIVELKATQDLDFPLIRPLRLLDIGKITVEFGLQQTVIGVHRKRCVVSDGNTFTPALIESRTSSSTVPMACDALDLRGIDQGR